MPADHLTFPELAAYTGIPLNTLRDWRKKGHGPKGVRVGPGGRGRVYFKRAEVHDWLRRCEAADPLAQVTL